jgi:acetylornithine deacetylase/succinyl-diaminopimelate desuccinylase-like protein/gamma-glutamyl:cysteine ligase YbdK (ATP-grasp superfamily)
MPFNPQQFAEKYKLALDSAIQQKPEGGLNGFELEWNLLDDQLRPLLTVGSGPAKQSFVDYLRAECLPAWLRSYSQLEVFHWMIEWATRPYFTPHGAVYEGRLMEAVLMNALAKAGAQFSDRLYHWHGNLLFLTDIGHESIPGHWGIAKRRYLERCVDLYGETLATAGTHTNLSLPDPLFAWDFVHMPASERGDSHLDQYKSEFYITATRLLRAFASLFIATSASTPLQAQVRGGRPVVVLTEYDSIRNLTFPNPPEIDLPHLYRSYDDYLQISYDLVRRDVRFGNNNWNPVRARSFAEPVERLISTTGDQLRDLYTRGLYAVGEAAPVEEMARQIEKQNLMARINLPMGRVEVRTDDGGNPLEVDIANLTFKHLLMLRIYADPQFARSFRYDAEDVTRARSNEHLAAQKGLQAEIENPLTGKPIQMRAFLKWTLEAVRPLAEALNYWEDLRPLIEMSEDAPNTAERTRARLKMELGANDEVPLAVLHDLAEEREAQIKTDVEKIAAKITAPGPESSKISELFQHARDDARQHPELPVRFRPSAGATFEMTYADKTAEILDLAQHLIRIPSVTACPDERLGEVHRAATFVNDYLSNYGLVVRYFDGKYPAVFAQFPAPRGKGNGSGHSEILLSGHFDVVEPEPDDSQFSPYIDGNYLWGRGAADMKTVVATYLVWMKDTLKGSRKFPSVSLLLVGNEENGETEAVGTPHALKLLKNEFGFDPLLCIAGERTGEKGDELFGEICTENRGVMRFTVTARGIKGHSGISPLKSSSSGAMKGKAAVGDLSDRLIAARTAFSELFAKHLTLKAADGWQSQARFPFIQIGTPGVYNITAAEGVLGVEIRPIPQDDIEALRSAVQSYCAENNLTLEFSVMENGIACDPTNPALNALIEAVRQVSGAEPKIGRKLPGTSARFAPGGRAIVWGQSGLGPHAKDERHYIPSIKPYFQALNELGKRMK